MFGAETAPVAGDLAQAQEALRHAEYRYRNMFRAMAVSFWELDFADVGAMLRDLRKRGITDLRAYAAAHPGFIRQAMEATRVIDVNEKTVQLFGGTCKADMLVSVAPFWPRASEHVYAGSLYAAVDGTPHFEAETKLATLDGREIDALFTCCYPRDDNGKGGAVVLVGVVDISDRIRAHDEVTRIQAELAHAARVSTLGELTASIAHEVNQPLAAIVTNGEAALRWLGRKEPDLGEAQAALQRIINEGKRASDIITRIRSMSTKSAPEQVALDCADLIEESTLLVRREMLSHNVVLRLDLPPGLPPIRADRVQVQQVVINLLVNAVQAMAQVPRDRRDLAVRARSDGAAIQIDIEDSGPGFAPGHAAQLFNAFFTTKATGMGMGLSICKSIVEAHGGRIWASPGIERGATFHVLLPAYTQV
jgi:signal transduction histidine kinase